jgi:acetyl-CoA C-acetyltransferase
MRSARPDRKAIVDDVLPGCVAPVMEQAAVLPKIALQKAGWDETVPGTLFRRKL